MKKLHIAAILLMIGILMAAMSAAVCAEEFTFNGKCSYDGSSITSDFTSEKFAASQSQLEPGDSLAYTIKYTNNSKAVTSWYMRNTVLETLEEAKDAAKNGGYTYKLVNVDPSGKEQILFDNSKVGGETKVGQLEGLKQATDATGNYFFIQKLQPGETGVTKLNITLDGETEVNDYMDTKGALMVSYAVEKESTDSGTKTKTKTVEQTKSSSTPRTGDPMNMLKYILMMVAAVVVAIFAVISYRRDKKDGEKS